MTEETRQDRIIRPVSFDDIESLRALYVLSLRNNQAGFIQDLSFHGDIAERAFGNQKNGGAMLGAFLPDDTLIGFGGLKRKEEGRVELGNLHLHPAYQGLGIGKQLAVTLIDLAREKGYSTIELHVTITQSAALGLYKRLGFVETGRKVYELAGGVYDTVFMELPIG